MLISQNNYIKRVSVELGVSYLTCDRSPIVFLIDANIISFNVHIRFLEIKEGTY